MGAPVVNALEFREMQGILVSSYAHLPCAAHRLLAVTDATAARAWLAALVPDVTTADGRRDDWSLHVALTHDGLRALGLASDALRTFSPAFQEGMAAERRSRLLGDVDDRAPERWEWGGPDRPVHVLLLMYAKDEDTLRARGRCWKPAPANGLAEVRTLDAGRQPDDNREHFGFLDGVGQPVIAGSGRHERQERRTHHATDLAAGEFVLGYAGEDGRLPPSPTIWRTESTKQLPPLPGRDDRRDLGRNGSYLVFRQLEQDVPGFWHWVTETARTIWPDDPTNGPTRLAAKMVGRWPSGAPLVCHPDADPKPAPSWQGPFVQVPYNDFAYRADDPFGQRCPLGAHIRRANPRDALGTDGAKALQSAKRHRLLRRGRSYGTRIEDPSKPDGQKRGLHFICLNADLERQFEFVQQTWINNPAFADLTGEVDPLVGAHATSGSSFAMQEAPLCRRARDLRSFVHVRGGAYWFVPGLAALRVLTAAEKPRE